MYRHFYMTLVHILRGGNSFLCTFIRGEIPYGRCIYQGGENIFYEKTLFCFVLLYACFFCCFMVFLVIFSIYALLFSSHCVYVLDMLTFVCHCALLIACSNDRLFCYMIIVVISIWLFCIWSSYSYVSHHVYLIAFLLIILYFSFYYLLYLKGLMRFVQVF